MALWVYAYIKTSQAVHVKFMQLTVCQSVTPQYSYSEKAGNSAEPVGQTVPSNQFPSWHWWTLWTHTVWHPRCCYSICTLQLPVVLFLRLICTLLSAPIIQFTQLLLHQILDAGILFFFPQKQKFSTSFLCLTWDDSPVTTIYLQGRFWHFLIERGLVEGSQKLSFTWMFCASVHCTCRCVSLFLHDVEHWKCNDRMSNMCLYAVSLKVHLWILTSDHAPATHWYCMQSWCQHCLWKEGWVDRSHISSATRPVPLSRQYTSLCWTPGPQVTEHYKEAQVIWTIY